MDIGQSSYTNKVAAAALALALALVKVQGTDTSRIRTCIAVALDVLALAPRREYMARRRYLSKRISRHTSARKYILRIGRHRRRRQEARQGLLVRSQKSIRSQIQAKFWSSFFLLQKKFRIIHL